MNQKVQTKPALVTNNVPAQKQLSRSFLPSDQEWRQIVSMADAAVKSGLMPSSIRNREAVAIIALKAWELEIPFMVGLSQIAVINGRPAMQSELIQALARKNHPGLVFNILESNSEKCVVEGCRSERMAKPLKISFTIEEAKRANLTTKDVWKHYPAAMLRHRATTALLRALVPEALMGVSYTPEELGEEVDSSGAIVTTSRAVSPHQPTPQEAPKEEAPPVVVVDSAVGSLEAMRRKLWAQWKDAGTEEGLRRYIATHFGVTSTSDLTPQMYEYLFGYMKGKESLGDTYDPAEEPKEKAEWEKEAENVSFSVGQSYDQVK